MPNVGRNRLFAQSASNAVEIGAGGLGDIAYQYSYQRFDLTVMFAVIVVLIILVMLIQAT